MSDNELIQRMMELVLERHKGQVDKLGAPYFFHPVRVSLNVTTTTQKLIALGHDLLEDTATGYNELAALFGLEVACGILILSKPPGVKYLDFIENIIQYDDPDVIRVKIADIEDNMSNERFNRLDVDDQIRLSKKYEPALTELRYALMMLERNGNG